MAKRKYNLKCWLFKYKSESQHDFEVFNLELQTYEFKII